MSKKYHTSKVKMQKQTMWLSKARSVIYYTIFFSSHCKFNYELHVYILFPFLKTKNTNFFPNQHMPVAIFDIIQTSAYILFLSCSPAILFHLVHFIYLDVKLLAPLSPNTLPFKHSFLSFVLLTTLVQHLYLSLWFS